MHGFTIRKKDDTDETVTHFRNCCPPFDAAIRLDDFHNRRLDRTLNPCVLYHGSIGAFSNRLEVRRRLYDATLSERRSASKPSG